MLLDDVMIRGFWYRKVWWFHFFFLVNFHAIFLLEAINLLYLWRCGCGALSFRFVYFLFDLSWNMMMMIPIMMSISIRITCRLRLCSSCYGISEFWPVLFPLSFPFHCFFFDFVFVLPFDSHFFSSEKVQSSSSWTNFRLRLGIFEQN